MQAGQLDWIAAALPEPLASALARNLMSSSLALTMPLTPTNHPQPGLDLTPIASGSVITVGRTLMS